MHIWLATSEETQIEAEIFQINQTNDSLSYHSMEVSTKVQTIHAGKKLYIHLVTIEPHNDEFPNDKLLGYNLFFSTSQNELDLGSLNLLNNDNPHSIVYGDLKYPSFFIQKNNPTNILYGSCQKPHGNSNNAFTSADITIQEQHLNIQERPSSLFLMGDQIYADDVADALFYCISKWADILIGEDKDALTKIDERLLLDPFSSSINQIHSRQYIMDNFAKFSSKNADNHMIRFSEYAVMYLLTLSPVLWEHLSPDKYFPTFEDLLEKDEVYLKFPDKEYFQNQRDKEVKKLQKNYGAQSEDLNEFIRALPQIRRILANTSTYMIFDDHDITDDWNISANWFETVYGSNLGKNVVANGLTAYLLFQGWGNAPDVFEPMLSQISNNMDHYLVHSRFDEEWVTQILQFHLWAFVAPTNPKSVFLDTRTLRAYDVEPEPVRVLNKIDEASRAAQLIGKIGWRIISDVLHKSGWKKHDALVIISPTPFYGIGIIESFLRNFVYPLRISGIPIDYDLDFEAWKYNGKGFNNFLQMIAKWNPKQCIILSGDVHYAGAVQSLVHYNNKRNITIHQFTSSPIHNMSFSGIGGRLMKIVVWFNSIKRKHRVIYRSLNEKNKLLIGRKRFSFNKKVRWHEEIKYLTSSKGSVIETQNNIGLITIDNEEINNRLLMYNGKKKKTVFFK